MRWTRFLITCAPDRPASWPGDGRISRLPDGEPGEGTIRFGSKNCTGIPNKGCEDWPQEAHAYGDLMTDLLFILTLVLFFTGAELYAAGCGKL